MELIMIFRLFSLVIPFGFCINLGAHANVYTNVITEFELPYTPILLKLEAVDTFPRLLVIGESQAHILSFSVNTQGIRNISAVPVAVENCALPKRMSDTVAWANDRVWIGESIKKEDSRGKTEYSIATRSCVLEPTATGFKLSSPIGLGEHPGLFEWAPWVVNGQTLGTFSIHARYFGGSCVEGKILFHDSTGSVREFMTGIPGCSGPLTVSKSGLWFTWASTTGVQTLVRVPLGDLMYWRKNSLPLDYADHYFTTHWKGSAFKLQVSPPYVYVSTDNSIEQPPPYFQYFIYPVKVPKNPNPSIPAGKRANTLLKCPSNDFIEDHCSTLGLWGTSLDQIIHFCYSNTKKNIVTFSPLVRDQKLKRLR